MSIGLDEHVARLEEGRHHDPFQVLGRHRLGGEEAIRAFLPGAETAAIAEGGLPMQRCGKSALFEWRGPPGTVPRRYRVRWRPAGGGEVCGPDPYAFPPLVPDFDLHLFSEGRHRHAQRFLGARLREFDGIAGVLFATWAPNAQRVSVVGDFNAWDGRRHPMRSRGGSGIWELFVPGLGSDALYKFELRDRAGRVLLKTDPYGRRFERRPATAAIVVGEDRYRWDDAAWLARRAESGWLEAPMSIYEVHLGSWARRDDGGFLDYRALAERLVPWVESLGFTHIELLPITEHPLDGSWGYQTTGFFAPTSRFGDPDGLRALVDRCHARGIGVLLDWVPGHFPRDGHALARFDGTALYEHADPRRGEHRDWGTLIFNYARNEVRTFLLSSAMHWVESFHIDGLRVDAVASMLYLDYSREPGDWLPNERGGNENLEAIAFLRELNHVVQSEHPGVTVIAEESTAWPQVTRPPDHGGLGFSMKWNMGWMHDTLAYLGLDPLHRRHHHDRLTFGLLYAHTENFVLALSHDEVVHGKRSLLAKMPGDAWQRLANLRLLFAFMFTYPGKKLLFMGAELAAEAEWNEAGSLDWGLAERPANRGVARLVTALNRCYRAEPSLHRYDFEPGRGFEWLDCEDAAHSVICYSRRAQGGRTVVVCVNFTPVPRHRYRVGLPEGGRYRELLNTDAAEYGGSGVGDAGPLSAEPVPWMGRRWSVETTLPPLAALVLAPEPGSG